MLKDYTFAGCLSGLRGLIFLCVNLLAVSVYAAHDKPTPDLTGWKSTVRPFLEKHCVSCHGAEKQKGDLNLEDSDGNILDLNEAGIWHEIVGVLNAGEMPPEKKPRPGAEELIKVVEWISGELTKAEQLARAKGPGLSLRRLTNQEYRNSVRDLVGHPFDPSLRFLEDTQQHGFDNLVDNLGLSTLHLQQYLHAAERIVEKMLDVPAQPPSKQHWLIEPILTTPGSPLIPSNGAWHDGLRGKDMKKVKPGKVQVPKQPLRNVDPGPPGITGLVRGNIEIPNGFQPYRMVDLSSGKPVIYDGFADIRAFGSQTGGSKHPNLNRFGFRWFAHDEGKYRVTLHVNGYKKKGPAPSLQVMRYPALRFSADTKYSTVNPARSSLISMWMTWNICSAPAATVSGACCCISKMGCTWNALRSKAHLTRPGRQFMTLFVPEEAAMTTWPVLCATLPHNAWRRPLLACELEELVALFKQQRARTDSFRDALRVPLVSILSSPHFLCRVERRTEKKGLQRLNAHELANRLSYFLWRSMPDDLLRAAADDGSLLQDDVLRDQVERMLAAPAISAFCETFPARWLGVEKVMSVDIDPRMFPEVNWALRYDMLEETRHVFTEVFRTRASCLELIDCDWTVLNSRLARHYGLPEPKGDGMRRVSLPEDSERGGILAHGSILTITSNGMRTLPITRGAFVLENILASPTSPPPPNVTPLEEVEQPRPNATTRELLELHRKDPTCINCHKKIDPIGFSLEQYDAVGRWRSHEHTLVEGKRVRTHPVDTLGQLPDGKRFQGLPGLKKILLEDADKFRRCLVEKMLVYALG